MRDFDEPVDVLIIGAGPVGMVMAIMLGKLNVNTLIVDKSEKIYDLPRAIALDNEVLRIFQSIGLGIDQFRQTVITNVHFISPIFGKIASVNTLGSINCHPKLVTFYQPELESALDTKLKQCATSRLVRGMSYEKFDNIEEHYLVTLTDKNNQRHHVKCRYLIGADGANSRVRKDVGLDFQKGKSYLEDWLVFDVLLNEGNTDKAIDYIELVCDPRGPYPHMPAPGNRLRWEFKLKHGSKKAEEFLTTKNAQKFLEPWFPNHNANIERMAIYRFRAKVAPSFIKNRIFLIGDAAHLMPPFIGQGLVTGIRDAANLSWKLSMVLSHKAKSDILKTYNIERRPHAISMTRLAVLAGKIVMPSNFFIAFLIHGTVAILQYLPKLKRLFQELEIKPRNRFKKGLFHPRINKTRIDRGNHLPQTWLLHRDGRRLRSDDISFGKFRLIGIARDPIGCLSKKYREKWLQFGGEFLQICYKSQSLYREDIDYVWEDESGTIVPNYAPINWLLVVRPDQVIFIDGPVNKGDMLIQETFDLLGFK